MQFEVNFLFGIALAWIIFATIEDIRSREIANWLNFSLAIFALGFRFFYSLFELGDMMFFYQGLIGLGIFIAIGNIFYYSKMFAGGDAKLMMSLGAILPISYSFIANARLFFLFLTLFLVVGAIYGIVVSIVFGFRNFKNLKKEMKVQFKKQKKMILMLLSFALIVLIGGFFIPMFFYLGILLFILPYFYLYVKSVDEACMVKTINPSKLTEGDWLYRDVVVGKKKIKATWDGVSLEEIKLLQKKKKVVVRYGVQFAPTFFFSFIYSGEFWNLIGGISKVISDCSNNDGFR